ncbi:unnamed protein product [Spirodela intermedia]|uniref:VQ domain-containing protein n=1 Tax=Spirodela intermedia TaxID=51605 RepID=A0A7I8KBI1_SPIIN|nr:unnamed protein product [Spirodela intermedia]
MEKSADPAAQSSSSSSVSSTNNVGGKSVAVQNALRQLHKSSHKISKPTSRHCSGGGDGGGDSGCPSDGKAPSPSLPVPAVPPPPPPSASQQPLPQPPVYNINKNDFREVVQKLTGSPAHQPRLSSARELSKPAAAAGGGASSRLQKIRPPPLAQLTPRSSPSLAPAAASDPVHGSSGGFGVGAWPRSSPLSPLPPLPTVSASAESPISAYMRCLRSGSVPNQQSSMPSPGAGSSGAPLLPLGPPSPLGLGCVPSPRSAYQMMLSPGLFLPPSPGRPLPSPRWKDQ